MGFSLENIEKIAGEVKILVSDAIILLNAAPAIHKDIQDGKSLVQTLRNVAPEVLPIIEGIANFVAPGSGMLIEIIAKGLYASHKMTPAEEGIWFNRAQGLQA